MKELFEKICTTSFAQFLEALEKIRNLLDEGNKPDISKKYFLMLLRPYYWFVHKPGFQDIIDTCESFMQTVKQNKKIFLKEADYFIAISTFLAHYLDFGDYDSSGWKMLFSSPEIAASVIADKYAKKLGKLKKSEQEVQAMKNLKKLMEDIETAKHLAYWCLRHIADGFLEELKIIHSFPPDYQSSILHALDAFPGNKDVIDFYKNFINKTKHEYLKEDAEKYM